MVLRAAIFDCDGVLADTEPLHLRVYNQMLAPLGVVVTADQYAAHLLGLPDREAFAAILTAAGREALPAAVTRLAEDKARAFAAVLSRELRIYPGVAAFVRSLGGAPCAVASGALRSEIEAILRGAMLSDAFSVIVAAGDVPSGKPDPAPFLAALAALRARFGPLAPEECLVVEDSVVGVTAARRAGMRCLAVTNSYDAAALADANLVVSSLAGLRWNDLPTLLAP